MNTITKSILSALIIMGSASLSAQCNANFSLWSNANAPASAFVNSYGNNASDGIYVWNWGDGTPNDTTDQNNWSYPTIGHTYASTGTYSICLNYSSASASCAASSCNTFTVTSTTLPAPFINIQAAMDSSYWWNCPMMPAVAEFYISAEVLGYTPEDSLNVEVAFGDGTDTLLKMSPYYYSSGNGYVSNYSLLHTYYTPGYYSVQYIVSDNAGNADTVTNYNEIFIPDSCGTLNGYVYFDENVNCVFDAGDAILANTNVLVSDGLSSYWAWVDTNGYYSINVPVSANYTVTVPVAVASGYQYSCGSAGVSTSAPGSANVGISCPSGFDLQASEWGWGFRPGMMAYVSGYINNISCLPQSGTATLTLDPNTTFVSQVSGSAATVSGNQVTWSFINLNPLSNYWANGAWSYISVDCSTSLNIGDSVCFTLDVSPTSGDLNSLNNSVTHCYPVRNSWDPNFKEVSPKGIGSFGYVAPNTEFTYTVHFQNTGTDAAYNIAVIDTIDSDLDMSTFSVIGASHYVEPHLVDGNVMKFQFNNIMLPDSASNPAGSEGWVTYKIKAKPNQAVGTKYTNTGYIYFDFNPAIITNTTSNEIGGSLSIADNRNTPEGISVAPNPVNDFVQVTFHSAEMNVAAIQIVDVLGNVLSCERKTVNKGKNNFSLETKNLSHGVYFIRISDDSGKATSVKIVK
jgi:fimbrial isopeptide formation D2 family protein